jgi:hypothetical protein
MAADPHPANQRPADQRPADQQWRDEQWPVLTRWLAGFPDAVLSGLDADGGPVSARCRPHPDHARQRLELVGPPALTLRPGPASLLCHSHDAELWRLRSFLVRGRIERSAAGWSFVPSRLVPGTGMSGPIGDLRGFVAARRRAARYLTRRGLPRPSVPWQHLRPSR